MQYVTRSTLPLHAPAHNGCHRLGVVVALIGEAPGHALDRPVIQTSLHDLPTYGGGGYLTLDVGTGYTVVSGS